MKAASKKIFFLLVVLLSVRSGSAQIKDIGLAFVKNYFKNTYSAGTQNWDIVQDPATGMMYFANNEGILEFDGNAWQTYKVTNNSVVRSVSVDNSGRIYAGAFNEMGYLDRKPGGPMKYVSLTSLLPEEYRNFDEIWKIHQTRFGIVFQSFRFVFIYDKGAFRILKPFSSFGFSFYLNDNFYIVDREKGILTYRDGQLQPLINHPEYFSDTEIRFIIPGEKDQLMIGTLNKGIFIFDGKQLTPWKNELNQVFKSDQLFSGIVLKDGNLAFGSIQDGLFIVDRNGKILQHINRFKGLQNNTILSEHQDRSGNLWLGLDNGISFAEISSPVTYFNYCYGIETGYASVVYKGMLYLGTNQGLFARPFDQLKNTEGETKLRLLDGTEGQVWNLTVLDGQLFCGHNNGTFLIDGYTAQKISNQRGGWTFLQLSHHPDKILEGTYNGLILYEKNPSGKWAFSRRIRGFSESSKTLLEDTDGSLWISHGYKGIFRLQLNEALDSVIQVRLFSEKDGLPGKLPCNICKTGNDLIVTTSNGIFKYNPADQKLIPDVKNTNFFRLSPSISQIQPDAKGNLWIFADHKLGIYRFLEDGSYKEVHIPFLKFNNSLVPAFEHLYTYDEKNIFIGILDGFVHYDPTLFKNYQEPFHVFIRKVKLQKKDTTLSWQGNKGIHSGLEPQVSYKNNSLSFTFAAPYFEDPEKTVYRYRLTGFDDNWSDWTPRNIREYTNLHEGKYTFEVQAQNIYQNNSSTDSYTFFIRPPFYRSRFAYIVYILLIASVISGNFIYFKRRIDRTRLKEKLVHEKKMIRREQQFKQESIQAEKEIERLKNEKLIADIRHKNKELANSTMHLIQKNKFLNLIKNELNDMIASNPDEQQKARLRMILKRIDRDLSNEKYWKVFDDYFDEVHQDFLTRLKEKHPELSPRELRLCAYLRMNISSKEIAALLNISIRGVEVSRYRLRKNLGIERDTNLTEYILNF